MWTNPELASTANFSYFSAQTINIDTTPYNRFVIDTVCYDRYYGSTHTIWYSNTVGISNKPDVISETRINTLSGYQLEARSRLVKISSSGITFDDCLYAHNLTSQQANYYLIPVRIYGANY